MNSKLPMSFACRTN